MVHTVAINKIANRTCVGTTAYFRGNILCAQFIKNDSYCYDHLASYTWSQTVFYYNNYYS